MFNLIAFQGDDKSQKQYLKQQVINEACPTDKSQFGAIVAAYVELAMLQRLRLYKIVSKLVLYLSIEGVNSIYWPGSHLKNLMRGDLDFRGKVSEKISKCQFKKMRAHK